jgi:hypothetical protein
MFKPPIQLAISNEELAMKKILGDNRWLKALVAGG